MRKKKRLTAQTIALAVLAAILLAGVLFIGLTLRPVTFTASDGTTVAGWRWMGTVYIDTAVFDGGMDVALDIDERTVLFTEPVDADALRLEVEQTAAAQLEEETAALDAEIEKLQGQLAEREDEIADLQARLDEMEDEPAGAAVGRTNTQNAPRGTSGTGTGQGTSTGGGTGQPAGNTAAPTTPANPEQPATPAPTPTPEPTPSVDAGACISAARAYGIGLGLTEDSSLTIGNSGYLNPPDITALSQDSVISDLKYCLDVYASYSPGDPSLVHFNIVQSGNLIYVLYA